MGLEPTRYMCHQFKKKKNCSDMALYVCIYVIYSLFLGGYGYCC